MRWWERLRHFPETGTRVYRYLFRLLLVASQHGSRIVPRSGERRAVQASSAGKVARHVCAEARCDSELPVSKHKAAQNEAASAEWPLTSTEATRASR